MDEQKKYTLENGLSFLMKTSKKNERWCAGLFLASFAALNFPAELISAEFPDRLWAALLQHGAGALFMCFVWPTLIIIFYPNFRSKFWWLLPYVGGFSIGSFLIFSMISTILHWPK